MPDEHSSPRDSPEESVPAAPGRADALPPDPELPDEVARPADGVSSAGSRPRPLGLFLAVGLGGALGALARYGVEAALTTGAGRFPIGTLLVNLSGSALIGAVIVLLLERLPHRPYARPLIVSGLLGGYTTFSTYMVDAFTLIRDRHLATALLYVTSSLVGGVLAVVLGMLVARRLLASRSGEIAANVRREPSP